MFCQYLRNSIYRKMHFVFLYCITYLLLRKIRKIIYAEARSTRNSLFRDLKDVLVPSVAILDFAGAGAWSWVVIDNSVREKGPHPSRERESTSFLVPSARQGGTGNEDARMVLGTRLRGNSNFMHPHITNSAVNFLKLTPTSPLRRNPRWRPNRQTDALACWHRNSRLFSVLPWFNLKLFFKISSKTTSIW